MPEGIRCRMVSLPWTLMVAGVVAALETHDQPALRAEHVHNLSLALVAPLGADNDRICHISTCTARMARAKAEVLSSTRENPVA